MIRARHRLEQCLASHPRCKGTSSGSSLFPPTRLIDVAVWSDSSDVVLRHSSQLPRDFRCVALSYYWGLDKPICLTTRDNGAKLRRCTVRCGSATRATDSSPLGRWQSRYRRGFHSTRTWLVMGDRTVQRSALGTRSVEATRERWRIDDIRWNEKSIQLQRAVSIQYPAELDLGFRWEPCRVLNEAYS
jgi:hypothetical protein